MRTLRALSSVESEALAAARNIPDQLLTTRDAIRFRSESDAPALFPPGAGVRFSANTGATPTVTFNRSLLYRATGTGQEYPIDIVEAFGVVGSAVLSGWAGFSPEGAFTVGTRLGRMAVERALEAEIGRNSDAFRISDPLKRPRLLALSLESVSSAQGHSILVVNDGEKDFSLITLVREALPCGGGGGTADGVMFKELERSKLTYQGVRLVAEIRLKGRYICSNDQLTLNEFQGVLGLSFNELVVATPKDSNDRAFRFKPDTSTFVLDATP